jgi:hypothetical protein
MPPERAFGFCCSWPALAYEPSDDLELADLRLGKALGEHELAGALARIFPADDRRLDRRIAIGLPAHRNAKMLIAEIERDARHIALIEALHDDQDRDLSSSTREGIASRNVRTSPARIVGLLASSTLCGSSMITRPPRSPVSEPKAIASRKPVAVFSNLRLGVLIAGKLDRPALLEPAALDQAPAFHIIASGQRLLMGGAT